MGTKIRRQRTLINAKNKYRFKRFTERKNIKKKKVKRYAKEHREENQSINGQITISTLQVSMECSLGCLAIEMKKVKS